MRLRGSGNSVVGEGRHEGCVLYAESQSCQWESEGLRPADGSEGVVEDWSDERVQNVRTDAPQAPTSVEMRQATPEELAYVAGILDGEGSIGVHGRSPSNPSSFAIRVSVIMTTPQAPALCHELFGGSLAIENRVTSTGKPIYRWSLYCTKAARVLEKVLPYLRVKKTVATDCMLLTTFYKQGIQSTSDSYRKRVEVWNRIASFTRKPTAVEAVGGFRKQARRDIA